MKEEKNSFKCVFFFFEEEEEEDSFKCVEKYLIWTR
jgi:hypothetical protein